MKFGRLSNHLFPTKENGYIPHVLRLWSLLFIFCLGLGVFSFAKLVEYTGGFGQLAEVYPAVIETLTNADRTNASLHPLSVSEVLTKAAQLKANDMAANGYFAHTSPSGITPWYWFNQVGYQFRYAGENLAVNFDDSQTVQTAWLNSPTHKANIMNGNFTEIGVATAQGMYNGKETTFVVEMFGRPAIALAPQIVSAPAPSSTAAAAKATAPVPKTAVAGESVSKPTVQILKSDVSVDNTTISKYMVMENTDTALAPAPTPTVAAAEARIPWYKQLFAHSSTVAGIILSVIIIILFFATAAMVARAYERHHVRHIIGGSIVMAMLLASLFMSRLGLFRQSESVAYQPAPVQAVQ